MTLIILIINENFSLKCIKVYKYIKHKKYCKSGVKQKNYSINSNLILSLNGVWQIKNQFPRKKIIKLGLILLR